MTPSPVIAMNNEKATPHDIPRASPPNNNMHSQIINTDRHRHLNSQEEELQHLKRMGGLSEPLRRSNGGHNSHTTTAASYQYHNPPMSNGGGNSKLEESAAAAATWSPRTSSNSTPSTDNNSSFNSESCDYNERIDSKKNNNSSNIGGHPLHHQQYDNNNTETKRPLHEQLSTNLTTELLSLHTSTAQAIQMSYTEQEDVSNDITSMQLRISYLKRKIGLARQELISKGNMDGNELLRLSLVKEVDSDFDMTDNDDDDETTSNGMDGKERNNSATFEVTYESCKPTDNNANNNTNNTNQRSSKLGSINSRKGLLTAMGDRYGSQNSGLGSHATHDSEGAASGTSSIFRITFGGVDGMPSRWRAREVERERSEKKQKTKQKRKDNEKEGNNNNNDHGVAALVAWDNTNNNDSDGSSSDDDDDGGGIPENTKEQQLITLKQLVNERESEISFLEREMQIVHNEKSQLEKELSTLTSTFEQSSIQTIHTKEKLKSVIEICQLDNRRLERELLETSVSLDVKKMNIELLGKELREARNTFVDIQWRKEREKSERRSRGSSGNSGSGGQQQQRRGGGDGGGRPSTATTNDESSSQLEEQDNHHPPQSTTTQTTLRLASGERRPGSARNTTSLSNSHNSGVSMESVVTMMSALTSDFSDLVDVLEGIDYTPPQQQQR